MPYFLKPALCALHSKAFSSCNLVVRSACPKSQSPGSARPMSRGSHPSQKTRPLCYLSRLASHPTLITRFPGHLINIELVHPLFLHHPSLALKGLSPALLVPVSKSRLQNCPLVLSLSLNHDYQYLLRLPLILPLPT